MEFFTMDRDYVKQDVIDFFTSAIWTNRYYGDGEIELVVPTTSENSQKLKPGTFIGLVGDDELMILETREFLEDGTTKITGITLTKWLNNRFLRIGVDHRTRYLNLGDVTGGVTAANALGLLVDLMCVQPQNIPMGLDGSDYETSNIVLKIPGLAVPAFPDVGPIVQSAVQFGPLYDALRELAVTYQVGMRILYNPATDNSYTLLFDAYHGVDRTSAHTVNPVRFSPKMDSLTKIKELNSIAPFKTVVWVFAPGNPNDLSISLERAGKDRRVSIDESYSGFDLRAEMAFAEDITTDQVGGSVGTLLALLDARASQILAAADKTQLVDGQIVPGVQFKYGVDYNLGDIVEVEGPSGTITRARVTEYIRTQDKEGVREYPTLSATS